MMVEQFWHWNTKSTQFSHIFWVFLFFLASDPDLGSYGHFSGPFWPIFFAYSGKLYVNECLWPKLDRNSVRDNFLYTNHQCAPTHDPGAPSTGTEFWPKWPENGRKPLIFWLPSVAHQNRSTIAADYSHDLCLDHFWLFGPTAGRKWPEKLPRNAQKSYTSRIYTNMIHR